MYSQSYLYSNNINDTYNFTLCDWICVIMGDTMVYTLYIRWNTSKYVIRKGSLKIIVKKIKDKK